MNWNRKIKAAIQNKNVIAFNSIAEFLNAPTKQIESYLDLHSPNWKENRKKLSQEQMLDWVEMRHLIIQHSAKIEIILSKKPEYVKGEYHNISFDYLIRLLHDNTDLDIIGDLQKKKELRNRYNIIQN